MPPDVTIRTTIAPGDLGRLISLHGVAYENEPGDYGLAFEAYVARTIAEFILDNNGRGRIWLAESGEKLLGSAAMVDRGDKGQLRWVVLAPEARGQGLGKLLIEKAMDYAAANEVWSEIYLETTSDLAASMAIYQKLGFKIVREEIADLWAGKRTAIKMAKALP